MIKEVAENIYCIEVPLPNNPLKNINSYFIRGNDTDLLIDTGFRRAECRDALISGLQELGADKERLDVVLTHVHADHSGLAPEFAGEKRKIYMSKPDIKYLEAIFSHHHIQMLHSRYLSEGFPEALAIHIKKLLPSNVYSIQSMDPRITGLDNGECLSIGSYTLQSVLVPGHTPGNMMFRLDKKGILFTGDHVLFDISPNIPVYADVEDSLGDYLASLRKVMDIPVSLALPGHRKPGNYKERIVELLEHHQFRIAQVQDIVASHPGLCAYEIAQLISWHIRAKNWDNFPDRQKWFAMGETLSHLDHLRNSGKVVREKQNGVWKYTACSTREDQPCYASALNR